MKLMLVAETDVLIPHIQRVFNSQSTDTIHYANPLKAMDNLDEVSPEVVLFSAADFPRHWKPFIIYLRNLFHRNETTFVLLIGKQFDPEEAAKAEYLDVNAVLHDDLATSSASDHLRGIVSRYHQTTDIRRNVRHIPGPNDRIHLEFTNPYDFSIYSTVVTDISSGGMRFRTTRGSDRLHLDPHTILTMSTLRLGDELHSIPLRVIRSQDFIAVQFMELPIDTEKSISDFLLRMAARQAQHSSPQTQPSG